MKNLIKVTFFFYLILFINCKKQIEESVQTKSNQKIGKYSDISNFKLDPLDFAEVYTLEEIYNDDRLMNIPKCSKYIDFIIENKESMPPKAYFVLKLKDKYQIFTSDDHCNSFNALYIEQKDPYKIVTKDYKNIKNLVKYG